MGAFFYPLKLLDIDEERKRTVNLAFVSSFNLKVVQNC